MLLDRGSATQNFSDPDATEEVGSATPATGMRTDARQARSSWKPCEIRTRPDAIASGDEVVFARPDLAEVLGIWRHAKGRVIGIHDEGRPCPQGTMTVDVQFEGHEILCRYLPDLFEKRAI